MPPQDDVPRLHLDGESVTIEALTYREKKEMRKLVRELCDPCPACEGGRVLEIGEDRGKQVCPRCGGDGLDNDSEPEVIPALICVWKRRSDSSFTIDQALEYTEDQLTPPTPPAEEPSKPSAKRSSKSSQSKAT